jgi:hypothetical protein
VSNGSKTAPKRRGKPQYSNPYIHDCSGERCGSASYDGGGGLPVNYPAPRDASTARSQPRFPILQARPIQPFAPSVDEVGMLPLGSATSSRSGRGQTADNGRGGDRARAGRPGHNLPVRRDGYVPQTNQTGSLRGICPVCERLMHRRVNYARLAVVARGLEVTFQEGEVSLRERTNPTVTCDFEMDGSIA